MSPAALTELHWSRVPAVAIFGCFVADADGEKFLKTQPAAASSTEVHSNIQRVLI
jgi:hypothetical protein